jgi:hypothetical protein
MSIPKTVRAGKSRRWAAVLEFVVGCFGIYGFGYLAKGAWAEWLYWLLLVSPLVLVGARLAFRAVGLSGDWAVAVQLVGAWLSARRVARFGAVADPARSKTEGAYNEPQNNE